MKIIPTIEKNIEKNILWKYNSIKIMIYEYLIWNNYFTENYNKCIVLYYFSWLTKIKKWEHNAIIKNWKEGARTVGICTYKKYMVNYNGIIYYGQSTPV